MTPEQREKAVEKMRKERKEAHEKYAKEAMAKLTPGQKAEVQQFIKDDMAQRQARHERLQHMTPEQREAIRANRPLPQSTTKVNSAVINTITANSAATDITMANSPTASGLTQGKNSKN